MGSLGNGDTGRHLTPVPVSTSGALSGKTIKAISSSWYATCAIASDNNAYCWGDGGFGVLGNGNINMSSIPVAVDTSGVLSGKGIIAVDGGYHFFCALASDNKPYCWGSNTTYGNLGNNSMTDSRVPVAVNTSGVLSGKTIVSISSGNSHACALDSSGKAYCWGWNGRGQLGNGLTANSSVPVAVDMGGVLSGRSIKSISAGREHTCVVASDDKAYCWGGNISGEIGDGSTILRSSPVAVSTSGVLNGKTIKSVATGNRYSCVIASDGRAYCWGENVSTLGSAGGPYSMVSSTVPVAVDTSGELNGKILRGVYAHEKHVCVNDKDGTAYCWGLGMGGNLVTAQLIAAAFLLRFRRHRQ